MLIPSDPPRWRQAINLPHQPVFKVTVLNGSGATLSTIDYLDGSVSATLGSQVTRTAEILVNPALSPLTSADLLYPNGNRLYIERGLDYGCGITDLLPVFHGRINKVIDVPDGPTRISCVDLAGDVRDAQFPVPTQSVATNSILEEYKRLVSDALPSASFGASDTYAAVVGVRTWDVDRAQGLDDMSNAVSSFWYTLAGGQFVMRRYQWTIPNTPILRITDDLDTLTCRGDAEPNLFPGLSYLYAAGSQRERSREQVFNVITVASELVNGQTPYVYTASDTDPASPTYIGGNYGFKSRHVRSDVAQSAGQVRLMADNTLRRTKALTDTWALQTVPDARLELGDCIYVGCQRKFSVQVIAAIRMPLNPKSSMEIGTRALIPSLIVGAL